jgi:hypothetical protein
MNPITQIFKIFEMLAKMVVNIVQLFQSITEINEMIECPIRIFTNIDTCAYYYGLDLLMIAIQFYLKWGVCFFIFWIPCFTVLTSFQVLFWSLIPGLWDLELTVDMCCPSKDTLSFFVEFINTTIFKRNYILKRTNRDLRTCYCLGAVRSFFDPYTNYLEWLTGNDDQTGKGDLILAVLILGLLMIPYMLYGRNES